MKSRQINSAAGNTREITITRKRNFVVYFLALLICAAAVSAQTYKDIYDFDGTTHGCCPRYPNVLAQGRDGNLYGTAPQGGTTGGGIVFKITTDGTLTVLYNFDITHGYGPNGGLILGTDGNLYGTAQNGGAHNYGNIFKITPAGELAEARTRLARIGLDEERGYLLGWSEGLGERRFRTRVVRADHGSESEP